MSDKPSILEGGSSRNFNPVDVLSINKQSDGLSTWVLYDSVEVGSLDASQNGLYLAIEDDYFAYDQIVVNVSDDLADADDATKATGKITGKDPNLDPNNDYAAGLDENGNLTKEMIPAAIHIVVPPRKRKYLEGETLDFSGIHVYLMDGNNHRYTDSSYPTGEIPFGEMMFPVTVAEGENGKATKDGVTVEYANHVTWQYKYEDRDYIEYCEARSAGYLVTNGQMLYAISDVNGVVEHSEYIWTTSDRPEGKWREFNDSHTYSIDGKTYYYANYRYTYYVPTMSNWSGTLPIPNSGLTINRLIDIMFNGVRSSGHEIPVQSSGHKIPVQWMRSDGEILEDTFDIEIGESEEGEEQPDPWGGYADVSWNGHHYNFNRRLVPPVQYSNGYCWRQQAGEYIAEYTVEQAASMGWLILIR